MQIRKYIRKQTLPRKCDEGLNLSRGTPLMDYVNNTISPNVKGKIIRNTWHKIDRKVWYNINAHVSNLRKSNRK